MNQSLFHANQFLRSLPMLICVVLTAIAYFVTGNLLEDSKLPPQYIVYQRCVTASLFGMAVLFVGILIRSWYSWRWIFDLREVMCIAALTAFFIAGWASDYRSRRQFAYLYARYNASINWNRSIDKRGHWELTPIGLKSFQLQSFMKDIACFERSTVDFSNTEIVYSDLHNVNVPKGVLLILFKELDSEDFADERGFQISDSKIEFKLYE